MANFLPQVSSKGMMCLGSRTISLLAGVVNIALLSAAADVPNAQRFTQWCLQQENVTEAAAHTVQALLDEAQTLNCEEADLFLSQQERLDLSNRQISDLRPLTSFPQLRTLILDNNQITTLTPLRSLRQLETLMVGHNQLQDLRGLSSLNQLQTVFANDNQISTVDAIATLPTLRQLIIPNNQVESVPELSQLTHLDLNANTIEDVEQFSTLSQLVELKLSNNAIVATDSLASLNHLEVLDLRDNPLTVKTCPVLPITICIFSDDATKIYQEAQQQLAAGRALAAREQFQAAAQLYAAQGDRARQLDALTQIGNIYDDLGQYANALTQYEQALCLAKLGRDPASSPEKCDRISTESHDPEGEAITLARLGMNRLRLGQFEKAASQLKRSLDIAVTLDSVATRDGRRSSDSFLAPIFDGLALAHAKQGQYDESLQAAKLSLGHYRNYNNHKGEAIALNRVGQAYLSLGNLVKAKIYFDKALDRTEEHDDRAGQALSLDSVGDYFSKIGQRDNALAAYQKAQNLWQSMDWPAEQGKNLNATGRVQLEMGNTTAAIASLERAVEIWELLRSDQLTDQDKISLADTQAQTYQLLQQALVKSDQPEAALEISEKGRARAFAQLLAHRLSLRGEYASTPNPAPPDVETIKQIAQQKKATLVEYSIVDHELYIWVISPHGEITLRIQEFQSIDLPTLVKIHQEELRGLSSPRVSKSAGQQLYNLLIQPIADLLPTTDTQPVIIIPQQELFLVPFAALSDSSPGTPGTYLIDRHPLLFAPAISLLGMPATGEPLTLGNAPALAIGNPTMPIPPNGNQPLQNLEHAKAEVQALEPFLGNAADILIGEAATEAAVRATIETVKVAHFATHGLLDDFGTDMPGAIALAPTEAEPGFLTTQEIMAFSLNAQLVVLSACDTGGGAITGDGVMGLSRSFLTAGVDNVVVSLWAVKDESTKQLMLRFYRHLYEGQSPAIALQQAMIGTRGVFPHPEKWAAFSVFGQPLEGHLQAF